MCSTRKCTSFISHPGVHTKRHRFSLWGLHRTFSRKPFEISYSTHSQFWRDGNRGFLRSKHFYIHEIGHVTTVRLEVYAVCWKAYKTRCTKRSKKVLCIPSKRVFSLSLPTWEVFNFSIVWRGQLPLQAVHKQTFLFVCMLIYTYMSRWHERRSYPI